VTKEWSKIRAQERCLVFSASPLAAFGKFSNSLALKPVLTYPQSSDVSNLGLPLAFAASTDGLKLTHLNNDDCSKYSRLTALTHRAPTLSLGETMHDTPKVRPSIPTT
jgi:hypothetical protein